MRITIEVKQAEAFSFVHVTQAAIEDAVLDLLPDPHASVTVTIERDKTETNDGIMWR